MFSMIRRFKNKAIAAVASVIAGLMLMSSIPAGAIDFNGSSGGGGGNLTTGGKYSVSQDGGAVKAQGYRFSVVDYYGNTINDPVDVLMGSSGNSAYRFVNKYNKILLKQKVKAGVSISTALTNAGVCHDTDINPDLHLPTTVSEIKGWVINSTEYFNQIVKALGVSNGINGLERGSKVTIEPLFRLTIEGSVHCLTATEIAAYGRWMFGGDTAIRSNSNSGSWGFIADYTNRQMPISLFLENDEFVGTGNAISKGWDIPTKNSMLTFNTIINNGFGLAFVYNDNRPPTTDLKATNIQFTHGDSVDSDTVSEPLREYETYRPIYTFYNDGPSCTANFSCTNYATGHTITQTGIGLAENQTYKILGDRFVMSVDLYNTYIDDQPTEKKLDYDFDSMWLVFSGYGEVLDPGDSDTTNNTYTSRPKFAIANPTNVINASTYENYSENYTGYGSSQNNNLYTGLVNLKETSTSGQAPINGKYSVTDGTVSITSNNTPDCAVVIPGYAYLTEGTVYKFSMETNGDWCTTDDHVSSEKIEAWLFPEDATDLSNGFTVDIGTDITYGFSVETEGYGFNMMKKLDDGSYLFACRKTGKYRIRLDANMSPGTITFSDIRIEEYGTTTYLGSFDNVQYWSSAENHTHYVSNGKLYMETGVNADGNAAFFDDTQVAPVTLIECQEYVINIDTDCPVWAWDYNDTVQFYLACNGNFSDNTITIGDVGNYGGLGKFINPVQIGENTFKITCKQTAKYYWRFDVNSPYTTHWFAPPETYNITEREQINISGENLYTGFKNATLPTVTYGEIRIPADTVIHNGVATVINSNTEIRQVTEIGKSQEAYFYDTTGSARLIAGHKYIFQCETNGTWAITGEGLENSVGLQESLHNADNVSAYLIKLDDSGNIMLGDNSMITLGDTNNSNWVCMTKVSENTFMFSPKVTGNYILRLDVNKMGKTYWFKNPKIYNVTVHESNYPSSNKDYIDLTNIKLNTVSGKIYSGQEVRFSSETQGLSMFNAKYATELSAKGLSPTSFIGSIINKLFNPFLGSFAPAFAKWETTLSDDGRAKYTNENGLGAVDVTATSYETSIIGKYPGRDNEFKQISTKRYTVYPTDLEAVSVKVYDADTGKKITTVKDGQKVKVEYVYTNNTQLPVFATVMYTGNINKTFSSPTVSVDTGVTEIGENDYTPLLGDANGDGTIDIFDKIKITKAVGSVASEGDVKDVNLDGKITKAD